MPEEVPEQQHRIVAVYATDWNEYCNQHGYSPNHTYKLAKGWMVGFLLEENEEHLVLCHTIFGPYDVRYAVVVSKSSIIERRNITT